MKRFGLRWILLLLLSCNQIERGETLSQRDIEYIRKLDLLDQGEHIIRFYSQFKTHVAGNFFTDQRVAAYWIDERNSEKNRIVFAYYKDIEKMDTIYIDAPTYTSYLLVTKNDSSKFKIFVDGGKRDVKSFFDRALQEWRVKRTRNVD